jgi:HEAT repeat protein
MRFTYYLAAALALTCAGDLFGQTKSVDEWIEQSRAKKSEDRKAAYSALGELAPNDKNALRTLIAGLNDDDRDVSILAVHVLECLHDSKGLMRALVNALNEAEPLEVRRGVAWILHRRRPSPLFLEVVPILCAALKDDDGLVRVTVARTLWQVSPNAGDLVPVFLDGMEDENPYTRLAAMEGLSEMGPHAASAANALGKRLAGIDGDGSSYLLSKIGKAAVPTLILGLGSESIAVRARSACALDRVGSDAKEAVPALHGALRDDELEVRLAAADALWSIEHDAATVASVFTDAYQSGHREERVQAVRFFAAASSDSAEALVGYLRAFQDGDAWIRQVAIKSSEANRAPLTEAVVRALVASLRDGDHVNVELADHRLQAMRAEAHPYLIPLCCEGPPRIRAHALTLLWQFGDHEENVADICLRTLREDTAPEVRTAAASKLAECPIANRKALPQLFLAFRDMAPSVREEVANILGSFETDRESISAALIEGLKDPEELVRCASAESLGRLGHNAKNVVPALIGALNDSKGVVRRSAGIALGRYGSDAKAAIPFLAQRLVLCLHDDNGLNSTAQALSDIGVDAVPALAEALTHKEICVRIQAARVRANWTRCLRRDFTTQEAPSRPRSKSSQSGQGCPEGHRP